jgi:hypothetical protein
MRPANRKRRAATLHRNLPTRHGTFRRLLTLRDPAQPLLTRKSTPLFISSVGWCSVNSHTLLSISRPVPDRLHRTHNARRLCISQHVEKEQLAPNVPPEKMSRACIKSALTPPPVRTWAAAQPLLTRRLGQNLTPPLRDFSPCQVHIPAIRIL